MAESSAKLTKRMPICIVAGTDDNCHPTSKDDIIQHLCELLAHVHESPVATCCLCGWIDEAYSETWTCCSVCRELICGSCLPTHTYEPAEFAVVYTCLPCAVKGGGGPK